MTAQDSQALLDEMTFPHPVDKGQAERAFNGLFNALRLPSPDIVWVDSPYEMLCHALMHYCNSPLDSLTRSRQEKSRARSLDTTIHFRRLSFMSIPAEGTITRILSVSGQSKQVAFDKLLYFKPIVQPKNFRESLIEFREIATTFYGNGCFDHFGLINSLKLTKLTDIQTVYDLARLSRSGCGHWMVIRNRCFVSMPPIHVEFDDRNRLHNPTGPALSYADGFNVYVWHGMRLPEHFFINQDRVTAKEIITERNVERRRAMIEAIGPEQFFSVINNGMKLTMPNDLTSYGLKQVDDWGKLWQWHIPNDEAITYVEVVNSTPEPDGSWKHYWLRVPPTMRTAREAVLWTHALPNSANPLEMT